MYNLDNKADLDLKMRAFYNHVSTIKSTIEEFNETGKIQLIKDIIVVYDKEMTPLLEEIRNMKYKYISMEQQDDEIKLVRKVFTMHDMMYAMETQKVESFVLRDREEL